MVVTIMGSTLDLLGRAPPCRPAAHDAADHGRAAARAVLAGPAVGDDVAGVRAAAAHRRARGGADLAAQMVELLGRELAGGPDGGEAGAPEHLVGEQVADAG